MQPLLLTNSRLYTYEQTVLTDVLIEQGHIRALGKLPIQPGYKVVPLDGKTLAPGFCDVHIQGAGGADVLDATEEALTQIARTLVRFGITGFLATTVIKPEIENAHLRLIARHINRPTNGAKILGIHLEGPFINPQKRGGIAPTAISSPSLAQLDEIMELTEGHLKMMTLAPELEGNLVVVKKLCEYNVVASLGHTNASYEQAKAGIEAGISHVTHICNAMPGLHHREPGPIAAIFEAPQVTAQIISDGVHLHPAMVNFLFRNLGPERCVCISDGIQAIGLPDGKYRYNGREYIAQNGSARYDDGTLIGTALPVSQIALRFQKFTNCPLNQAIDTITINPARVLRLNDYGKIAAGCIADMVVLNDDNSVALTIVNGEIVFEAAN